MYNFCFVFSFFFFFFLCEKYRENRLGCPLPVVTVALINLRKTPFLGRFPDSVSFDLRRYLCDGNDSTKAHSLRNCVSCLVNETFYFISVSQLPYLIFTFKPLTIRNQQFLSYILRPFEGCFSALQLLLNQYVSHRFNVLVAIISPGYVASLPHVLESSWFPPVPNPIRESALPQSFSLFPTIPILALAKMVFIDSSLNPSPLQLGCKEAREPMSFFHVLRPSEVARYLPSAISEYRDLAWWLMTTDLNCWPIFIPRQILLNGVFQ